MEDDVRPLESGPMRLGTFFAMMILIVVLLASGWTIFRHYRIKTELASTQSKISTVQQELETLREEQLDALVLAQQTKNQVKKSIQWSKQINDLIQLMPSNIFFSSYSASVDGRMSVSVLADSYQAAADLIELFNTKEAYADVFVGSVARGSSETGGSVVSFTITFKILNS